MPPDTRPISPPCPAPQPQHPGENESHSREPQLPLFGAIAQVGDGEVAGLLLLELGEQGERVVVRDQVEADARSDGSERPEDGGVTDRVGNHSRVEHDLGFVRVTAGATAAGGYCGGGGVQFNWFNSHALTIDLT